MQESDYKDEGIIKAGENVIDFASLMCFISNSATLSMFIRTSLRGH